MGVVDLVLGLDEELVRYGSCGGAILGYITFVPLEAMPCRLRDSSVGIIDTLF
jgi:hypothetical protein